MKPVCDQGLLLQPGGVELVAAMVTPEPDQNQPAMKDTVSGLMMAN